ncbi:hypothetical protein Q5698_08505 [Brucella intermedia]|uniref:hypothetical protein n=1 Tax=Brucella intermedia TaxID=94625 RepID=UPI0027355537|nr:hypothetical protein [Brucella intermedia]WLF95711.1 hypothetical protein Q5698_08505 [Brucella intermedia]
MTTLPEEAVTAAASALRWSGDTLTEMATAALTAALPFLPVQVAVNIDAIVQPLEDIHAPGGLCRWTDVATAIGEVRRALSALEPSAARELALEEILREVDEIERKVWAWSGSAFLNNELEGAEDADCKTELYSELCGIGNTMHWLRTKICSLSSPDHADAGKVEGDARADLERFWRPISEADKSITFEETFDLGDGKSMTIRNSDHYWVRDADGRVYEATWSDHKGGYWWDLEGESPVDPVEYMPHPLSLPTPPSSEVA